jgi:demethylmenaquinone methyltransferase/2-methoxy-6-polyprenyl-1,4-benzoquinol methylase
VSNSDKVAWDTQDLPQGEAKAKVVQNMFDAIAPRYDMVNRIMTFRLDTRWRKIALAKGARVLDLASGTGDLCVDLRKAGLIPLSFDMSFGMLAADHSKAPRVQADILRLPIATQSVDGVTCGFALRNLVDLNVFFHEIARVTKSGGRIALLDVSTPTNPLIRWGNSVYFGKVVPRIGGLLSNRAAYNYLPKSVAYLPSPEQLVVMLQNAGFEHVRHEQLSGGLTQLMHATKK